MHRNRGRATVSVPKLLVRPSLAHLCEPSGRETVNDTTRLQDWDRTHTRSSHDKFLGANKLRLHLRFSIFEQHRDDFPEVLAEVGQILTLAVRTRESANISDVVPRVGAPLDDCCIAAHERESPLLPVGMA